MLIVREERQRDRALALVRELLLRGLDGLAQPRDLELGAGVGEVELLRHRSAPALEEIGADRNNELRVGEAHSRPRDAVGATVRLDRGMIGLEIDAEVRPHTEGGQPLIEKRGKAPRFVLIEKDRVGPCRASTR